MNKLASIAALVLAATALVVTLWSPRETVQAPPPAPPVEQPSSVAADVINLERRMKALEDTAIGLSRRLMEVEKRPMMTADGKVVPGASPALAAEVEKLREEVRGMVAGEALNSEGGRDYLKDVVRNVQDEIRTQQRAERQEQWHQVQAQQSEQQKERVRQFVTDARLDYNQEQTLNRRMEAEATKRQALIEEVRAGTKSARDMRQAVRAETQLTDKEMNAILSEEQLKQYEAMRRSDRGFGGGPPGGRAGGRGR
ncbi:hypothetical protein [Comamonas sp. JC664]|uniref:hypothetical protein n=1 Tax=Comamonas sp. JC664 TaxID=2801917 RepID=UPI001749F8A0|nr:hypothetical protein [Comamonas sp. JC664]MBL0693583.1 hypothetical protein [Comamonas sp. JC664]GHG73319.1 hypothetical protein GCM10012319_20050 [Comamonas sp. KCTC 72670]